MRVLVVGSGGREHALCWRLRQSKSVTSIDCAPGNPGIGAVARLVPIAANDLERLVERAAAERYDLVVVGPEEPLCLGLADELAHRAIPVFGCSRAAAEIEGSKSFAKEVMERAGVATARWRSSTDATSATAFSNELFASGSRSVVKVDGLAAGKGVVVCGSAGEAKAAIERFLHRGASKIVVEEFLVGREASCMALVDAERVWPLAACEDHKPIFAGDTGPMTGGMGAISPTPVIDSELLDRVAREVLGPTARAMAGLGRPFRGVLYAGLMITADGPKVLEFNCRFGDPETQPIMVRFRGDLGETLLAVATGGQPKVEFDPRAAVCVVLAEAGYPGASEKGKLIEGLEAAIKLSGVQLFHAGTAQVGDRLVTSGGRVLGVTALGGDLFEARAAAYHAVDQIHFPGMQFRKDIGARG